MHQSADPVPLACWRQWPSPHTMGSTPILRIALIYFAIFSHHFLFTSTTTAALHLDPSALSAGGGVSSGEEGTVVHSTPGRRGIAERVIGEEELYPEGDLASQFGFGHSRAGAFGMAKVVDSSSQAAFSSTKPLPEFAIDYGHDVVTHDAQQKEISLVFDTRGGARWRTNVQFDAGTFSVKIKTPDGDTSGLNTSFYLSSLEGHKSQDEIDFEFLGKDKGIVQTNFYTEGTGNREEIHQLGFDSSTEFHDYTIKWLPSKIEWLIDGKLVRTAEKTDEEAYPVKPMYLYASIWNAGDIDDGKWAGSYSGAHEPYTCKYRDVHVPVTHSKGT